jgi:hypothetical protein
MGVWVSTQTRYWYSKIIAITVVFVRVVFALKHFIEGFMNTKHDFNLFKYRKSHIHQKMGLERDFYEGRQRTEETERQQRTLVDLIKLNT